MTDDTKKHYDDSYASGQYAEKYSEDRPFWAEAVDDWCVAFAAGLAGLHPSDEVLDLGSGVGFMVRAWMRHGMIARGLELSSVAAERATSLRIPIKCGDATDPAHYPADAYGAVFSNQLLEHLTDDQARRVIENSLVAAPVSVHYIAHHKGNDPGHINIKSPHEWYALFNKWCPHAVLVPNPLFQTAPIFVLTRDNKLPGALLWAMRLSMKDDFIKRISGQ